MDDKGFLRSPLRSPPKSPTKSELATFQVLANLDFVNLHKAEEEPEPSVASVHVLEEDDEKESSVEMESIHMPTPLNSPPKVISPPRELPKSPEETPDASAESTRENSPSPTNRKNSKYKESTDAEIEAEKEGLLAELQGLEKSGAGKPVRPLTMDDSLEEIQFQYDRIQAEINASQMVDFAKSAIKMGSGMAEMLMKKAGVKVVDGYHNNLCKDMNKFNRPLNRLYKKYWRRGGLSPEAELGFIVLGSLAYTVVQNKMGSAAAAFGENASTPEPPPRAPMKPPQMTSLNIPTSWANQAAPPTPQPFAPQQAQPPLKVNSEELRAFEIKKAEMEQKEQDFRRRLSSLEEKEARVEERELALQENDNEEQEPSQARTVVLNTPRKSGRGSKKSVAIDL